MNKICPVCSKTYTESAWRKTKAGGYRAFRHFDRNGARWCRGKVGQRLAMLITSILGPRTVYEWVTPTPAEMNTLHDEANLIDGSRCFRRSPFSITFRLENLCIRRAGHAGRHRLENALEFVDGPNDKMEELS